jgi:integrase
VTDYPESTIDRLVERCEAAEECSQADADALLDAHRQMELLGESEISVDHHADVLMRGLKMAREVGGLAKTLDDRAAAEEIVRWIHRTYDNPETNKGYRTCLRAFGRHALGVSEPPDSLAWIPAGYPSSYDPAPEPGKMLYWEDHIQPMINACQNPRDEALIALAWDLGPRGGELFDITVGDVADGEYGLKVTLYGGKQGTRSPTIVRAVPFVRDWVERHPGGGQDDPLWSRLNRPDGVSDNYVRDAMYSAAERADATIPAKPTPTRMRKSSASFLARQNVNQTYLEHHHGWSQGSKKASRYIAIFGADTDKAVAAAHGVEIDEDDSESLVKCVRCEYLNGQTRTTCRRCGQALSQQAAEAAEARQRRAQFQLAQLDAEQAVRFMDVIEALDDPEVAERADEFLG